MGTPQNLWFIVYHFPCLLTVGIAIVLLMEEILHHLKSLKSQELQYFRAPRSRWCKISSINSIIVEKTLFEIS